MGMVIEEDLPKIREILLKIDENINKLNGTIEHLYGKIGSYRKILSGNHHFNIEAMEKEIDFSKGEIKKLQKIIEQEKERKIHYKKIENTLKEKI